MNFGFSCLCGLGLLGCVFNFLFLLDFLELLVLNIELLFGEDELGWTVIFGGEDIAGYEWIPNLKIFGLIAALLISLGPNLRDVLDKGLVRIILHAALPTTYNCMSLGFWVLKSFTKAVSSSSNLSRVTSGSSRSVEIGDCDICIIG